LVIIYFVFFFFAANPPLLTGSIENSWSGETPIGFALLSPAILGSLLPLVGLGFLAIFITSCP
jgi:hypothetical protein